MDKDNVCRSSKFYMAKGDVLHILLRDWTCDFDIGLVDGDGAIEGAIIVNEGDTSPGFTNIDYGLLYNYYAITDARNIAPTGWHVPTEDDLNTFKAYIGATAGGGKLKETGFTYWNSPNTGATNELGFNLRGTGLRTASGSFVYMGIQSYISCSDEFLGEGVVVIFYYDRQTYGEGWADFNSGLPLRLIKDDSTNPGYIIGNDSKVYPTIKIGNQVWMACNSAETKYRNGDDIPEVINNTTWAGLATGALCAYNNDWDNVGDVEPLSVLIDDVTVEVHPNITDKITISNGEGRGFVGSNELDVSFFCDVVIGSPVNAMFSITDADDNIVYLDLTERGGFYEGETGNVQFELTRNIVLGDVFVVTIIDTFV